MNKNGEFPALTATFMKCHEWIRDSFGLAGMFFVVAIIAIDYFIFRTAYRKQKRLFLSWIWLIVNFIIVIFVTILFVFSLLLPVFKMGEAVGN